MHTSHQQRSDAQALCRVPLHQTSVFSGSIWPTPPQGIIKSSWTVPSSWPQQHRARLMDGGNVLRVGNFPSHVALGVWLGRGWNTALKESCKQVPLQQQVMFTISNVHYCLFKVLGKYITLWCLSHCFWYQSSCWDRLVICISNSCSVPEPLFMFIQLN